MSTAVCATRGTGRRSHLALARRGEDVAAAYLRGKGLTVLCRNWRCREGELDLVATDGSVLVVCEVKTRSGPGFGAPAEAVTPEKIARIRRLTTRWLTEFRVAWCPIRFDVIAIEHRPGVRPRIRHIVGAF
ncbi:YraN family protein [Qaidamihabitans albus]|uniref:YraN family protein n=1 Tax=Qaidamihabitans albus TaxID=2795733 RepID=UPI0018F1B8B3|nr:YraN family protein [Qaidamihabitans albus]